MDPEKAKCFKNLLSNEYKPIIMVNFEKNTLGD